MRLFFSSSIYYFESFSYIFFVCCLLVQSSNIASSSDYTHSNLPRKFLYVGKSATPYKLDVNLNHNECVISGLF